MKNYEDKKNALLEHCDKTFHPHVDEVLVRLPHAVRNQVLSDPALKIISFDGEEYGGLFIDFGSPVKKLIILNETLLDKPEFYIVHVIAHEIAHKIRGVRETELYEMETEKLLCSWGFERESKAVRNIKAISESEGLRIGYEWANQNDLTNFQEFSDECKDGRLSSERLDELRRAADIFSILTQMDRVEDLITMHEDSFEKGIVWGIMHCLWQKKAKGVF
ncbi:hypothetical protein M1O12_03605 [Dehalococcoidia bacterium]|nr:hypothetical protein [Dehalococcoidia bacterium]